MNTVETIQQKVGNLPIEAQQEILSLVERIEQRYRASNDNPVSTNAEQIEHPLTFIGRMSLDIGVSDFADRHDFYAHGKLED